MTDDSPRMSQELLFEAGKVAFRKGWDDPELVTAPDLDELPPSGPPVLLIAAAEEITADSARTVASLIGAGRQVSVVTDGPLPPEIASWLSDDIIDYPGKPEQESEESTTGAIPAKAETIRDAQTYGEATGPEAPDPGVALPDDASWMEPASPDVPDPYCEFVDPHESREWQDSPGALKFWKRFIADRGVKVSLQPAEAGVPTIWVGRWSLFDQQTDGCLILQFAPVALLAGGKWQRRVTVNSIIGHAPALGSGLDRPNSEQQRQFANQVTAFCEINEALAMFWRIWGTARSGDFRDLQLRQDAAFGGPDASSLPTRHLELTPADTVLLIGPHGPVEAPLPSGLAAVRLTYLVPITADAEKTADVLAHSIDAITRTHRLLWDPSSDLEGRRNPDQAASLQAFLESVGFVSYGGAAEILWESR